MPTNPIPQQEPTPKTQRAAKAVARFRSQHSEVVAFAAGAAMMLLSFLVR